MVYTLPRCNLNSSYTKVFFETLVNQNSKWNSNLFYKSLYSVKSNHSLIITMNNTVYYNNIEFCKYPIYYQKEIALNYLIKSINSNTYSIPNIVVTRHYGHEDIDKNYLKELVKLKNKKILNWLINYYFPYKISKQTEWNNKCVWFKPISGINLNTEKYLEKFSKRISELLAKYNVVVAGSHVIQHIFNLNYCPNDIDIYISFSLKKKFIEELNKPDSPLQLNRQTKDFSFANQYNMTGVDSVYSLRENTIKTDKILGKTYNIRKKYQIIFVNTLQPYDFVVDNFDFDICTSSFDFASNKFRIGYIKNQGFQNMRIQDSYINKMTGSETDSYSNYRANKTIERMCKYIERGFTIENWKEFLIEIRDKMYKD